MEILERKYIFKIFIVAVLFLGGLFTVSFGAEIKMTWYAETSDVKHLTVVSNGTVNIDWGDGTSSSEHSSSISHYYNLKGMYDIIIDGEVYSFECNNENVVSLECNAENLIRLECEDNSLSNLNLTHLNKLQELYCSNNALNILDTSNNLELRKLNISENKLYNIDLKKNINLENVIADNNKLERIFIKELKNLKSISVNNNRLTYFETSGNDTLNNIFCKNNFIENIKLGDNNQINFLDCSNNKIQVLDLSKSNNIKMLNCKSENLEAIILDDSQQSILIQKLDKTKKIVLKQVNGAKIVNINNFNFYVGTEKDTKIEKILVDGNDIGHKNEFTLYDDDLDHIVTVKIEGGIEDTKLAILQYPLENVYEIGDKLSFGGASCIKDEEFTPITINFSGITVKHNGANTNNIIFTPQNLEWSIGNLEIANFNNSQYSSSKGTHYGTVTISCCPDCGVKSYNIYAKSMESLDSFKIISIRDIRWEDYFVDGKEETGKYFSIPTSDKQMISISQNNPIKLGYAVEFNLETQTINDNKAVLVIKPKIIDKSNNSVVEFYEITDNLARKNMDNRYLEENKFDEIKIFANNKNRDTMFQTNVKHKNDSNKSMEWSWVYYLPASIDFDNAGKEICIKFDIELHETNDGYTTNEGTKKFSICKYVQGVANSTWNGKVFEYSLEHTLMEDIYNNMQN